MPPGRSHRSLTLFGAVFLLAAAGLPVLAGAASTRPAATLRVGGLGAGPYAAGEAVVRYERGASAADRRQARGAAGVELDDALALPRAELLAVEGSVAVAIRRLERQPGVAYAQPNYLYEATAAEPPDDTFFDEEDFLWGLSNPVMPDPGVGVLEAWEDPEGAGEPKGAGQVIAVLDTGVDLTHPDLVPNLWSNPMELPGGLDEDDNGFVDDLHGYDFVEDDGDPDDYEFHGTHVAGTAAAVADNAEGIAGVAPEAEIMAVRVLDGDGRGSTAEIADGIAYAAAEGADVINLSLGGAADPGEDQLTEDAIEVAGAKDAIVVAAAGNEAADNDVEAHAPCALPQANLICVAALNRAGVLSSFSNYGERTVDIAAPGGGDVAGGGILSAKTDYGSPEFSNGFEPGTTELWGTAFFNGGVPWIITSKAASGTQAAADSPGDYGQAIDPSSFAESELITDDPIDLAGERGCRVHFQAMYETELFFDVLLAGAEGEGTGADFARFTGTSPGYPTSFSAEEASISDLSGQSDVHPVFVLRSDEIEQRDGAFVDDVRVICRDETYEDGIAPRDEYDQPAVGSYVRFSGTSMATPHVSGVVALVRAATPGISVSGAIDAILEGASAIPVPSASRRTATEGIADACQAIAVATGSADPLGDCPGSSENVLPPPTSEPPPPDETAPGPTPSVPSPAPQARDSSRPSTFFRKRPGKVVGTSGRRARVVFRFGSDEPGVSFLCRIDRARFRPCGRQFVRRFKIGRHMVRVAARDTAGNVDATPAVFRFQVKRIR